MRWIESLSSARMTACVLALGLIGGVPAGHAQVTGREIRPLPPQSLAIRCRTERSLP
jgi:hypothetical protein